MKIEGQKSTLVSHGSRDMDQFTFYVVTYNVSSKSPNRSLINLLQWESQDEKNLPDFCVFGFQEIKSQPQNLLLDSVFDDPWTTAIRDVLNGFDYVKIRTVKMVGLLLNVFCRRKHVPHLTHMETSETRTGLLGLWGNKGAVSFSFKIYNTTICIVNSHFAAHEEYLNDRVNNYRTIVNSQLFGLSRKTILSHDYVFWIGDLNFRLDDSRAYSSELIAQIISSVELTRRSANTLTDLWTQDELRTVMENGKAFENFIEPLPMFPPTYRFLVGHSQYDLKRRPAWTDRILYKTNASSQGKSLLDVMSYNHIDSITLSDHKPVYGESRVQISNKNCVESNIQTVVFHPIQEWLLESENEVTLRVKGFTPNVNDWIGIYNENFTSLNDYLSYVYLPSETIDPEEDSISDPTNFNSISPICRVQFLPEVFPDGSKSVCLKFSETSVLNPGKYILIYFSANNHSVLGVSQTFVAVHRQNLPLTPPREFGW
ncbi:inositol polyphosphate 5-phosphatase K-like [Adelges cooleyi]|uniref:inositol polyphosphate 5-phosphatase K-like n=1 Tax=Adelges cooleyi TaxID=133065 RepID=UPI00217F4840|nr:inositol polyphosphate 5-phosphatase K-like [Adelges cooleyi]XP_050430746.1 inositol polyphosphate 5-phosphatase K-like [Adelges cooleyi]